MDAWLQPLLVCQTRSLLLSACSAFAASVQSTLPLPPDVPAAARPHVLLTLFHIMGSDYVPGVYYKGPAAFKLVLDFYSSLASNQEVAAAAAEQLPFPQFTSLASLPAPAVADLIASIGAVALHATCVLYAHKRSSGPYTSDPVALAELAAGGACAHFFPAMHLMASAGKCGGLRSLGGASKTWV
jgi:hypothetical protein